MPEGDTVWRTALHLHRALTGSVLWRPTSGSPRTPPSTCPGATVEATPRARQAPADPHRRRAHPPHAPEDGGLLAPLPPGHAGGGGPAHEARVVLRTDGWTAVGFALGSGRGGRAATPRTRWSATWARTCSGPDWDEDEALRRLWSDPRPPGRRRHPRPAQPRRDRQPLQERAVLPGRGAPAAAGGRGARPAAAGTTGAVGAGGQQAAGGADPHRRPAARAADVGVPAGAAALPALRHPHRGVDLQGPATQERATYWCPRCQPRPRRLTGGAQAAEATTSPERGPPGRATAQGGRVHADRVQRPSPGRPPRARPRR